MSKNPKIDPKFWDLFNQIAATPRPSKKEEKIIAYLKNWAQEHEFICVHDQHEPETRGNIVIYVPATEGMEKCQTVILQAHMDMVPEKDKDKKHDFENDPIEVIFEDEWVHANGTTLGADDGIGITAALYVATETKHGPLILLFTADEETGLNGAKNLDVDLIKDKPFLINLDSETFDEIIIGCAGGCNTTIKLSYYTYKAPEDATAYLITVNGLKGGHSGVDIDKGRANANKVLAHILSDATEKFQIELYDFNGGDKFNAIAREATAVAFVENDFKEAFLEFIQEMEKHFKTSYPDEMDLKISAEEAEVQPDVVIDDETQSDLLKCLCDTPHGVVKMSEVIPDTIETSTNLASCHNHEKEGYFEIVSSHRSSNEEELESIVSEVQSIWDDVGAFIDHSGEYPGWAPNPYNELCNIAVECFKNIFGNEEPKVKSIHGGLECGVLWDKVPELQMISLGPTICGAHSPQERCNIETVVKFLQLLCEILICIPKE